MSRLTGSFLVALGLMLSLIAGMVGPSVVAAQSSPAATPGLPDSEATYEVVECPFTVPESFTEGETLTCGFTTVPLLHDEPAGDDIRLFSITLSATSDDPLDTPLVLLAGGPGQGGSSQLNGFLPESNIYGPLLEQQDVVLLDQRGTGYSEPGLYCPGDGGPAIQLIDPPAGEATPEPELVASPEAVDPNAGTSDTEFVRDCRESFDDQDIQVEAFNTTESAADVNDVRFAMGYDQIDIYGVSYGSRLGLVLERDFPEIIRASVLASVLPPQVNQFAEQVVAFDLALDTAIAQCNDDPDCAEANPDLSAAFDRTVGELNELPIPVDLIDLETGEVAGTVPLDGATFTFVIYEALFISALLPQLPALITAADNGDGEPFGFILSVLSTALTSGFATGLLYNVNCIEEVPFATQDTTDEVLEGEDIRPALIEDDAFNLLPQFAASCEEWDAPPADSIENEPVTSDVPTLVVSGEFDPITPPSNGELAAETLSNGFVIELPAVGHDPIASAGPCGIGLMAAFLADPSQAPDTSCTDELVVDFSPEQ